ncbi:ATP-binding protein [Acinetobacter johnsonii]|uniref:AAA family ATPase n=1 Tax=Acinetobacter johnsonii TaxID=40214 RepID=UPI002449A753|nr:ATP-binding protein [Acinetobacter johnsonii]MDH1277182.1 ATP-binding protein [Acinetobacter johnsonii]
MLKKFEVKNFKSFKDTMVFDLGSCNGYEYNKNAVENGITKKGIIYGRNGSGKSNLGLALFDIVKNVTDFEFPINCYGQNYAYIGTINSPTEFKYYFEFENGTLSYFYKKSDYQTYLYEELRINDEVVVIRNNNNIEKLTFDGTEFLQRELSNDQLSVIAYLKNNSNLDKRKKKDKIFYQFIDFVSRMLFFRSLDTRDYVGYGAGSKNIIEFLVKHKRIKSLEKFLEKAGIKYSLETSGNEVFCKFDKNKVPLSTIMSSGTRTLLLFFYWLQVLQIEKPASLLFIDEFDAFYHFELAKAIVEELKTLEGQTLLTTHNTSLLSNELLRPDCYFVISEQMINSLPNLTDREIRAVHNLEKLYKAKAFE